MIFPVASYAKVRFYYEELNIIPKRGYQQKIEGRGEV
jgi:hypothetical protein